MSDRDETWGQLSFRFLCAIHQVQARNCSAGRADVPSPRAGSYAAQIQRALDENVVHRPFNAYITGGGEPSHQLPSVFLLRLAFVHAERQKNSQSSTSSTAVLQCIEDYLSTHGVYGIPPLFTIYLSHAKMHLNFDTISSEGVVKKSNEETMLCALEISSSC